MSNKVATHRINYDNKNYIEEKAKPKVIIHNNLTRESNNITVQEEAVIDVKHYEYNKKSSTDKVLENETWYFSEVV